MVSDIDEDRIGSLISANSATSHFELWVDRTAPGRAQDAYKLIQDAHTEALNAVQMPPRTLEAVWLTEFGEVDQVLTLWRNSPINSVPGLSSCFTVGHELVTRHVQSLLLWQPYDPSLSGGHIYDFRCYTLRAGQLAAFQQLMNNALPVRKAISRNVGVWLGKIGEADQIIHIWAYRTLQERHEARKKASASKPWLDYLDKIFPLVERMQTAMLVPAPFSPMQ